MSIFSELKRRNVFRVALAYAAVSWLLIQVVETLFPIYGLSDAAIRLVVTILAVGFIPVLVLAWVFELTPEGLKRDADVDRSSAVALAGSKKTDRVILAVLALALGYFAFDKFVLDPARDVELVEEATERALTRARIESFGEKSIAVLPFVNMSSDPDQVYFSDGIAEEMLNLLAKIPQLRVTSRSSAFAFRGDDVNIPEVAEKLNVAHVLEGSVRKAGNRVRITVQLIEARTDSHLWSETYDRPFDDIFAIQDEVSAQVVAALRLTLLGESPKAAQANVDAYPLYLKARQIVDLHRWDELSTAEQLLKEALEIDPNYVDAWIRLGMVYWYQRQGQTRERDDELVKLIEETALRVLALEPENVSIKAFEAFELTGGDNVAAARLYEEAAEIDPSHPEVLRGLGKFASDIGRTELAIQINEYIAERDPLTLWGHFNLAWSYLEAERYEDALRQYAEAANLAGDSETVRWRFGMARLVAGDPEGAIKELEQEPSEHYRLHGLSMAFHDLGREDESLAAIKRLKKLEYEYVTTQLGESDNLEIAMWPHGFARIYAWIGDSDEAFRYMRISLKEVPNSFGALAIHPLFKKLHDDRRWLPLLHEFGQAPEQLAKIEFNPRLPYEVSMAN